MDDDESLTTTSNKPSRARTPLNRPISPPTQLRRPNISTITPVLSNTSLIRNICILAHVDHGKTTLTDNLLASNGIISWRLAGQMRYMDSRADEQQRGITMQSSAITLLVDLIQKPDDLTSLKNLQLKNSEPEGSITAATGQQYTRYLINLIDSPGHVDFAGQVITATRISDGALVLVDAVEGVCPQTLAVLRLAWQDRLKPVLVINKLDRLITELCMSPSEASQWLSKLVAQVNAVHATIRPDDFVFDPCIGNVVFTSATDGWGFTIQHFAEQYSIKLGMKFKVLEQTLWGEWYYKNKTVVAKKSTDSNDGSIEETMFSKFILQPIWTIYQTCLNKDFEKLSKIATSLKLDYDPRYPLKTLMISWLPLAQVVFKTVVVHVCSPEYRIKSPIDLDKDILGTPIDDGICIIAIISKMISIETMGFVAMTRLLRGSLKVGQRIYCLQPRYNPHNRDIVGSWTELDIDGLYLLMGRDIKPLDVVYAGNVFGLTAPQLSDQVYKAATLTDNLDCPSLLGYHHQVQLTPLVRVAIQPVCISDWQKVKDGLDLLCQADPIAETSVESGELVLAVVGELHLEQCLKDLKERFAKVDILTSSPMIPFRETIASTKLGMTDDIMSLLGLEEFKLLEFDGLTTVHIEQNFLIDIAALPTQYEHSLRKNWTIIQENNDTRLASTVPLDSRIQNALVSGFMFAIEKGPLCGEPLTNIDFVILTFSKLDDFEESINGDALISCFKNSIHRAMLCWSPRLSLSTYSVSIQTPSTALGRVYSLLSRRHARVVSEEYTELTTFFTVHAQISVVESLGFADELRTKTSGIAMPQLVFSGFEVLNEELFFDKNSKTDDLDDINENDKKVFNRAQKFMMQLRERKGMYVERPLVVDVEKQRTLKH